MTQTTILAVDDDRTALVMLEAQLQRHDRKIITAGGGEEALRLARLHATVLDAVVLDRMMPGVDGMHVVQSMKQDPALRHIPIVMLTGSDSPEQMREGIDAGVFYYLTKPVRESVLISVLAAALRDRAQSRRLNDAHSIQKEGFHLIDTARFHYRSLDEAEALAVFLSQSFPDPARSVTGLAELLINAVEHGNLGIGYGRKTELLAKGELRGEILRRLELPDYSRKKVEVLLQMKNDAVYVQITDEGEGFDWKSFLIIDPSRATDTHGRGIAQANSQSFDALRYNARGNQVLAVVYHDPAHSQQIEW